MRFNHCWTKHQITDKGKRNQPNANSTVAPNNFNNSNAYFNDTDTFFNDSFQPSAQSTYYSASIQQQQQSIKSKWDFLFTS